MVKRVWLHRYICLIFLPCYGDKTPLVIHIRCSSSFFVSYYFWVQQIFPGLSVRQIDYVAFIGFYPLHCNHFFWPFVIFHVQWCAFIESGPWFWSPAIIRQFYCFVRKLGFICVAVAYCMYFITDLHFDCGCSTLFWLYYEFAEVKRVLCCPQSVKVSSNSSQDISFFLPCLIFVSSEIVHIWPPFLILVNIGNC